MNKITFGALAASMLVAFNLSARTTICFANSLPVDSPDMPIHPPREVYMNFNEGVVSVEVVSAGKNGGVIACDREDTMGPHAAYVCGDEKIIIDMPNGKGFIRHKSNAFGGQEMFCRDKSDLILK